MTHLTADIDEFLQGELERRGVREVTAVEAACWLDGARLLADSPHRPGLPLRELLRSGVLRHGEQRPPLAHGRWFIVRAQSEMSEAVNPTPAKSSAASKLPVKTGATGRLSNAAPRITADHARHRVTIGWMGKEIETLEDLLRPELRVICIGINPALTSVELGHYYQGRAGQRFLARLRAVDLLSECHGRWEDDVAFELGIGQTDIVKRPTAKAESIGAAEFAYGKRELAGRLNGVQAELVIFTFKEAAKRIFGDFAGHGFRPDLTLCGGEVFVMPGPYEERSVAEVSLLELRAWVRRRTPSGIRYRAPQELQGDSESLTGGGAS